MQPFGLPRWHYGKELATAGEVRDVGSHPGSGRFPGGHGNPLQDSCLENAMDRGAWRATVHGVAKSRTRLSDHTKRHNCGLIFLFQRMGEEEGGGWKNKSRPF